MAIVFNSQDMKAYTLNKYGENEHLQLSELSAPRISDNQVLVEIHAAGINPLDLRIKSGEFKRSIPYKLPLILGHDMAGVVIQVGSKVKGFKPGDQVYSRVADFRIGTLAEYIAVNESDVAIKPKRISMEEAASLPLVALTAWQAFVEIAKLQKGQRVFIQAGSGGLGTMAIQLAKYLGATVATTTSAKNFELVKQLGADVAIDYTTTDFATQLKNYDLALHSQDRPTLEKSLRITKPGGATVSVAGPPDLAFAKQHGMSKLMRIIVYFLSRKIVKVAKVRKVKYSFLYMRASGQQLAEISKLVDAGFIRPVVDRVFSFEHTNEAMEYVDKGKARGKVVVKIK